MSHEATASNSPGPRDPDCPEPFGFERSDPEWLSLVRRADAPSSLGQLGPYEILDECPRGGQGVVYLARQPRTRRRIALKLLAGGRAASLGAQRRFQREIEVVSALHHPAIVTVYSAELIQRQMVLAMEWIDGESAVQWSRRQQGAEGRSRILSVFVELCHGVEYAHQRGVVHRDLKPSNVLIDGDDRPRILDFGLAKVLEDEASEAEGLTLDAGFRGTAAYSSPEQLRDLRLADERSDVYSLGAMLHRMLTGRLPFSDEGGAPAILQRMQEGPAPPPSRWNAQLPRELDAILRQSLALDAEQRYSSAAALAADLERHLRGEPVQACPPGRWDALRKWARRNPAVASLGAALFLVLLASSLVATRQAWHVREQRDAALLAQAREAQARREAQRAHEETVAESQRTSTLLNFLLRDLVEAANPYEEVRRLEVREVFDRASERAGEFDGDPLTQRALHEVLGLVYRSLGDEEAAEQHRRAAARGTESGGDRRDEARRRFGLTLASSIFGQLAHVLAARGDRAGAETAYRQALELKRANLGPDHLDLASSTTGLATLLLEQEEVERALALYEEALRILVLNLGPEHVRVGAAHRHLARALSWAERDEEAEAHQRTAQEITRRALGDAHPTTLRGQLSLASYLLYHRVLSEERLREVEALCRDWLRLADRERVALEADRATATFLLAESLRARGETSEALPSYREALQLRRRLEPPSSRALSEALLHLGTLLLELGEVEESELLLDECRKLRRAELPAHHPRVLEANVALANSLIHLDDLDAAEELLLESARAARQGEDDEETASLLHERVLQFRRDFGDSKALRDYLDER